MTNRKLIINTIKSLNNEVKEIAFEIEVLIETSPDVQNYLLLQEKIKSIFERIEINQECLDGYER